MKSYLRTLLTPLAVIAALLGAVGSVSLVAQPAFAANPLDASCADGTLSGSDVCNDRSDRLFGPDSFWTKLINTMIFVVGSVAVLMIVIGGMRYVLSGGDASSTKSAKDTILYSIIGVIIALMAYAIVNFVVVKLV
jgi:hypothetical protein